MFIHPNRTRRALAAGTTVRGVISTSDDPQLAELCGISGFDYYLLDAEHGLIDATQAVNVVRACACAGITPLVRIGPKDPKLVLPYLDAGMMGVMMPGLSDADEVRMLVDAVKYPPLGKRGVGVSRASGYMAYGGDIRAYIDTANRETLVIAQFEDAALLPRLDAMLAVPGLDAMMIGPRDLSLAMGHPEGPSHPEVQCVIDEVIVACRRRGIAAGITAGSREDAVREEGRGARMLLATVQGLFLSAARAYTSA